MMISVGGGMVGLMLGYMGRNAIPHLLSSSWEPTSLNTKFDWMIFGFTAAISIFTGLLFGTAPAWQATRTQVSLGLKDNAQTATQRRRNFTSKTLVIIQVALSMLLLVSAGLLVRTLMNLNRTHLGFNPNQLILFDLQPPPTQYPAEKGIALYHRIEEKLEAMPGVDSATLTLIPLIANGTANFNFVPDGQGRTGKKQFAYFNNVGEHFFQAFEIPIIAGRSFNEADTETSRKVAVVNQALVKKFFPNTNPIGKTFDSGYRGHSNRMEIIGICKDAKYDSLRAAPQATFYALYRQQEGAENMTFAVRTHVKPEAIVPSLRSAVAYIDKDLPLLDIRTQNEQIDDNTKQERIFASLSSGFGLLALVLACIGIYGIMAYTVSRRTNEIGIRMALGAEAGRILRMVLQEASWLALIGVAAGLGLALTMSRLIASMLYGLKTYDPVTLVMAAALLIFVALVASLIPARRAASVDPVKALRHE